MRISGYYTRKGAAERLGVSPQRVSVIARRDGWHATRAGRSWLYAAEDVDRGALVVNAQKAWIILGFPRNLWGAWWLSDPDAIAAFPCPGCGKVAYSPGGEHSDRAACPSCGWNE